MDGGRKEKKSGKRGMGKDRDGTGGKGKWEGRKKNEKKREEKKGENGEKIIYKRKGEKGRKKERRKWRKR